MLEVHKSSSNTVEWRTLAENLTGRCDFHKSVLVKYKSNREERNWEVVKNEYTHEPTFNTGAWRRVNQANRSRVCRMTIHDFHHVICINPRFHQCESACECKFCKCLCVHSYHTSRCAKLETNVGFIL